MSYTNVSCIQITTCLYEVWHHTLNCAPSLGFAAVRWALKCIAVQLSSFEAEIWSWWKGHRLRWEGTKGGQCRSQWRGSKKLGISKVAPAFSQNIYILLDLIGFCSLTSHSSDLSLLRLLKPFSLWPKWVCVCGGGSDNRDTWFNISLVFKHFSWENTSWETLKTVYLLPHTFQNKVTCTIYWKLLWHRGWMSFSNLCDLQKFCSSLSGPKVYRVLHFLS